MFWGNAAVTLSLIDVGGVGTDTSTIMYSVDGSAPSLSYHAPILMKQTTILRASKRSPDGAVAQSRHVTFSRMPVG